MYQLKTDRDVITTALNLLEQRLVEYGDVFRNQDEVMAYLKLEVMHLEHEVFGCLWLNNQHMLIKNSLLFRGTINVAAVYPREVVKEGLQFNAAAVILYHNHPSGNPEPSEEDKSLTARLRTALATVDIRILDHIVIAGKEATSFAQRGLI